MQVLPNIDNNLWSFRHNLFVCSAHEEMPQVTVSYCIIFEEMI